MSTCFVPISPLRDVEPGCGNLPAGRSVAAKTSFRVAGLTRDIQVKLATERHEFEQAYELLAANYRARGYEAESDKPFRFTPYHALPGTVTIVAVHQESVVATLTLVPDSPVLGLPMESTYGPEVDQLRKAGLHPAEAISLADTGLSIGEFIRVFKAMITVAIQYHAQHGGNCWMITVNPRHSSFYQKVLGFAPLGPRRSYPNVQNHPAEAYVLTTTAIAENAPAMYQEVFGTNLPASVLTPPRWSEEHVHYFGAQSSQIQEQDLDALLESLAA